MARWLTRHGARVRVADTRNVPPCAEQLARELPDVPVSTGPFRRESFERVDLVAISPGVSTAEPLVRIAYSGGIPVVGDIELFAQALPAVGSPKVLAITGSNGKSTVTEMTGALCREAGLRTVVAGNIGLPVLDSLLEVEHAERAELPEVFVLELSSFQLETTFSLQARVAACLNLSEDHLDRYTDMASYAAAKSRVFRGGGVQVLNREDAWSRGMALPGRVIFTFGLDVPSSDAEWGLADADGETWMCQGTRRLMRVSQLRVAGLHNAANGLAALALTHAIDLPYAPLLQALAKFEGLPHRVQRIAEIEGVVFYDDSKGTNVGATVAALNGMRQKVVLIAGGDGKGQDFTPLGPAVASRARHVVLIGRDRERVAAAIQTSGVPMSRARDMEEAVAQAFSAAREGDAILLSPACASFDMFRNYEHRAQMFGEAVNRLASR
ncbi:MAG: UDP-N-acetylmuramoyl-L-alanine--D-glutamate ligase [Proteobacteria bacterium]|nr:MAG: UDP-N-acetylmuramoyl-L-alanine--D-glutamate ligase [Pseudomonadota bacterium]